MVAPASNEIVFEVLDDLEGGLVARALGHSIVTQAADFDAIKTAVRDAVACHFDDSMAPKVIRLHHVRNETIAA